MSYQNNLPETPTVREVIEDVEGDKYIEAKNERVSKIKQGQRYRANRKGEKYVCACELYSDVLTSKEKSVLHSISGSGWVEGTSYDKDIVSSLIDSSFLKRDGKKIKITSKSGAYPRYRRLEEDGLSWTITTHKFSPRNMLHPSEDRAISISEGLALQSFPESFELKTDSLTRKRELIGNAVPPKLAQRAGESLKEELESEE